MTQIICDKCKNSILNSENGELCCPSCGAVFSAADENLLLGITLYGEENKAECENALMKALVKDGSNSKALLYKALCSALSPDEDTVSFSEVYERIISAFSTADDCEFAELITIANDEMAKHEKTLTELHVASFETADAEKIKKEVESILKIRDEALAFRNQLTELAVQFNSRNESTLTLNLSRGFYVTYELADEIGDKKLNKIKDDIASHTVFTGILSSDIKNLEIYYRCVVMFFEKSKAKYDFLISNAKKLAYLNGALESGKYANVASPAAAAEKLKAAAYNFFEESLKEYDNDTGNMPTVTVTEPEKPEPAEAEEPSDGDEGKIEVSVEIEVELKGDDAAEGEAQTESEVTADGEAAEETATEKVDSENTESSLSGESDEAVEISIEAEIETEPQEENTPSCEEEQAAEDTAEAVPEEAENANSDDEPSDESLPEEGVQSEFSAESAEAPLENSDVINAIELAAKKVMDELNAEAEVALAEAENASEDSTESDEIISNSLDTRHVKVEAVTKEVQTDDDTETAVVEITIEKTEASKEAQEETATPEENGTGEAESTGTDEEEKEAEEPQTTLRKRKKKKPVGRIIFVLIIAAVLAFLGFKYVPGMISEYKYKSAVELFENGKFEKSEEAFKALGDYKDSSNKVNESIYSAADRLFENGEYSAAAQRFEALGEYKDSVTRVLACKYEAAVKTLNENNFDDAARLFEEIKDYGNAAEMIKECTYRKGVTLLEEKSYTDAVELFGSLGDYSDSSDKLNEAKYQYVTENLSKDNKTTVQYITELAKLKYRNSADLKTKLLGEEKTDSVKVFVNTSATDLTSSLKNASHTKQLYFHITGGEKYYGKSITLSYTTQYGYTQSTTVTLSRNNTDEYIIYPSSNVSNYTVTFNAYDESGASLGKVAFTVE